MNENHFFFLYLHRKDLLSRSFAGQVMPQLVISIQAMPV